MLENKLGITDSTELARMEEKISCLEVCPNFSANGTFAGAVAAVNAFRILNEEQEISHRNEVSTQYKENYFEGCGKSLACHNICPIGLPVEELIVRSNSVAIWGRQ